MSEKVKTILKTLYFELISAVIITYSVVPAFNNIGHLFYQIFLTAALITVFLSIADLRKIKPTTAAHSLIFMTVYWIGAAIIAQIQLHQKMNDTSFEWLHLFYYDKPAMLIVAFIAVFLFFTVKFIMRSQDDEFAIEYKRFQKIILTAFTAYYILIIFYCFFLVRASGDAYCQPNLVPFNVFNVMKAGEYEYEFIFLFFGNIGIFLPLGFLVSALIKNKPVIYILPFVLSIGIEISQYFFRNGQPDIDDVILNVLGYFLGYIVKILLDKTICKISKGKLKSIFVF